MIYKMPFSCSWAKSKVCVYSTIFKLYLWNFIKYVIIHYDVINNLEIVMQELLTILFSPHISIILYKYSQPNHPFCNMYTFLSSFPPIVENIPKILFFVLISDIGKVIDQKYLIQPYDVYLSLVRYVGLSWTSYSVCRFYANFIILRVNN